jgi:[pyruvate, water dikinase]-phosphate phosphotransferase / [pyruvate, water dikinase] kinase
MKTPTMLYLAYHGWFAANVPLILEVNPPKILDTLPAERVFCLGMDLDRLQELRYARAIATKVPEEPYASADHIRHEVLAARQLCISHHWRIIDVSGKSVEEVAREIIVLLAGQDRLVRPSRSD